MNTTENNKLIAKFMRYHYVAETTSTHDYFIVKGRYIRPNGIIFDKDWNWLMEVVQKINNQNNVVQIHENHVMVVNNTKGEVIVDVVSGSMLEATYEAVVEYVKLKEKKL